GAFPDLQEDRRFPGGDLHPRALLTRSRPVAGGAFPVVEGRTRPAARLEGHRPKRWDASACGPPPVRASASDVPKRRRDRSGPRSGRCRPEKGLILNISTTVLSIGNA